MRRVIIICSILLSLISCKNNSEVNNFEPIIGSWKIIDVKHKYLNEPNGPFVSSNEYQPSESSYLHITKDTIVYLQYPFYFEDSKKYVVRNDSICCDSWKEYLKINWSDDTLILVTDSHSHYILYFYLIREELNSSTIDFLVQNKVDWTNFKKDWNCHGYGVPDTLSPCSFGPHLMIDLSDSNRMNYEFEKDRLLYQSGENIYKFRFYSGGKDELNMSHECDSPYCWNSMFYEPDNGIRYYPSVVKNAP